MQHQRAVTGGELRPLDRFWRRAVHAKRELSSRTSEYVQTRVAVKTEVVEGIIARAMAATPQGRV